MERSPLLDSQSPERPSQDRANSGSPLEKSLRELSTEMERQYRIFDTTLSSIADFAYIFDREGRFLYANQALLNLWGLKLEDAVGKNFFDLQYPDELAARLQRQIQHVFNTREILTDETPYTSPTGAGGYYEYTFSPVIDAQCNVEVVAGSTHDITQRKQAEGALRQDELLLAGEKRVLELIASGAPLPAALEALTRGIEQRFAGRQLFASVLLLDKDGVHLRHGAAPSLPEEYNRAIDGIEIGSAVGSCGTAAYRKERVIVSDIATDPLWKDFSELGLKHGLRACWSTPITGSNGKLLGTFAIYYPEPGLPSKVEMEAVDFLTRTAAIAIERKQAEEAQRASEQKYRTLFESIDQGFCTIEVLFDENQKPVDYCFLTVNPAFEKQTGIKEAVGRSMREIAPHHEEHWFEIYGKIALTGEPMRFESRAEQLHRWYEVYAFRIGEPELRRVAILFNDISKRKQAEEALREGGERLRFVMESAPQKLFTAKPNGDVDYFNEQWTKFTGLPFEKIKKWGWTQFIHPDDVEENIRRWQHSIDTGEPFDFEHRFRRFDGSYRWHLSRAQALRDSEGKIVMWTGSNTDIEDVKKINEALRKSERLAAAGRMAAAVSHEINNPLEAVTNIVYLLKSGPLDNNARRLIELMDVELQRVVHITKQTLEFYRDGKRPKSVQVNDLMSDVIDSYSSKMKLKPDWVVIETSYEATASIPAHPGELRQLFLNLIGNAVEAGSTMIKVRVSDGVDWSNRNTRGIRVTIADNGRGIPPDNRKHLFEPFFTTKEEKGTGLGLWVSRGIVTKHEGSLRLRTSVRNRRSGTAFSIFLPSSSRAAVRGGAKAA